jgi:hypothetical protein
MAAFVIQPVCPMHMVHEHDMCNWHVAHAIFLGIGSLGSFCFALHDSWVMAVQKSNVVVGPL